MVRISLLERGTSCPAFLAATCMPVVDAIARAQLCMLACCMLAKLL